VFKCKGFVPWFAFWVAAAGKEISKEEGGFSLYTFFYYVEVRCAAEAVWISSSECSR